MTGTRSKKATSAQISTQKRAEKSRKKHPSGETHHELGPRACSQSVVECYGYQRSAVQKPLQMDSLTELWNREVWLTTVSRRKRAPTTTELDLAPKSKQARRGSVKSEAPLGNGRSDKFVEDVADEDAAIETSEVSKKRVTPPGQKSTMTAHARASITADESDNETGTSVSEGPSGEFEPQEESAESADEHLDTLKKNPTKLKQALSREIPRFTDDPNSESSSKPVVMQKNTKRSHSRSVSMSSTMSMATAPPESDDDEGKKAKNIKGSHTKKLGDSIVYYRMPESDASPHSRNTTKGKYKVRLQLTLACRSNLPSLTYFQKPVGKRAARREMERPQFSDSEMDSDSSNVNKSPSETNHNLSSLQGRKLKTLQLEQRVTWPEETHLVYSTDGKTILLKEQQPHIRKILRATIVEFFKSIVFVNAYPSDDKTETAIKALVAVAKRLDYENIEQRLKKDIDYAGALAAVPVGRLSKFRGDIKKIASQCAISEYLLRSGCADQIVELLEDDAYIYPCNAKGEAIYHEPFCHPAMIAVLKAAFFDGPTSLGMKCLDDFTSVVDDSDDPELPSAMVSLAATALYAVLVDWRSGSPPSATTKGTFNANQFLSVYERHEDFLARIFENSRKKYHVLMARLHCKVCTQSNIERPAASVSAFARLDFARMPEA
ncbi:hypothetical protein BV22DRAFT_1119098 [Leucogyrophana mollusca]|uniref:Uncharacterized protein n=1 Tax=Leucogyrophana mollusca TaxID=85980 RepID=A0ACB8BL77_9AGAM|nr:hypothetical protein BV22DRAFT_1119098 [Leucogyrophana mollusca]